MGIDGGVVVRGVRLRLKASGMRGMQLQERVV